MERVHEPPYTEPYVRWCERTASVTHHDRGLLLDATLSFLPFVISTPFDSLCSLRAGSARNPLLVIFGITSKARDFSLRSK